MRRALKCVNRAEGCSTVLVSRRSNLSPFTKDCRDLSTSNVIVSQFLCDIVRQQYEIKVVKLIGFFLLLLRRLRVHMRCSGFELGNVVAHVVSILAEGAIALPVTLSGGVLFAS